MLKPYELLGYVPCGEQYKYIHDPSVVSSAYPLANRLKKAYALMDIATDAYRSQEYEMLRHNQRSLENLVRGYFQRVQTYDALRQEFMTFLEGTGPYAIPGQYGPPSKETWLMKGQLQGIMSQGFITWDSQPGLYIDDEGDRYLQIPYLHLSGPEDRMATLLTRLSEVDYQGKTPVLLADPVVYENIKAKSGQGRAPRGEGLRVHAVYTEGFVTGALAAELKGHELVVLMANPSLWYLPFFTAIHEAAFNMVIPEQTLSINQGHF
ncbi:hypothetical protein D7Y13_38660 [Corallococcus praedator]|uniref:Uncharacterized protein n=1 Tax=Corallococcus praedator TaxID=2316724 RepID=A0ABX9Q7X6_9BACT|nr:MULTISPECIES: hypothetical protein [Corallococcus]RKH18429.1 hypothetical protein D7X75_39560 [Corallococcus sp. CA031C]RKH91542.1 hypothetical protein D7Y13_38660 [Corallococcus praedator]